MELEWKQHAYGILFQKYCSLQVYFSDIVFMDKNRKTFLMLSICYQNVLLHVPVNGDSMDS